MATTEIQQLDPIQVTPESQPYNQMTHMLEIGGAFLKRFADQPHVKKALNNFKKEIINTLIPEIKDNKIEINEEIVKDKISKAREVLQTGVVQAIEEEGSKRIDNLTEKVLTTENAGVISAGIVTGMLEDSVNKNLFPNSGFSVSLGAPKAEISKIGQDILYGSEIQYDHPSLLGVSLTLNPQLVGSESKSFQVGGEFSLNKPMDLVNMFKGKPLPSQGNIGVGYKYSPETGHTGVIKLNR